MAKRQRQRAARVKQTKGGAYVHWFDPKLAGSGELRMPYTGEIRDAIVSPMHGGDSAPGDDLDAQAIWLAKHRRECHVVSHRGCRGFMWRWRDEATGEIRRTKIKCVSKDGTKKCPLCKDEDTEGWQRRRWEIEKQANAWLTAHRHVPQCPAWDEWPDAWAAWMFTHYETR